MRSFKKPGHKIESTIERLERAFDDWADLEREQFRREIAEERKKEAQKLFKELKKQISKLS